jgi:hypothetical protein
MTRAVRGTEELGIIDTSNPVKRAALESLARKLETEARGAQAIASDVRSQVYTRERASASASAYFRAARFVRELLGDQPGMFPEGMEFFPDA